MIQKILRSDNPLLRQKSKPVKKIDSRTKALIADLKDTLLAQKEPEGVGLAAPQIGRFVRVFVMDFEGSVKTIINPKVINIEKKAKSKNSNILEGCLSIPHYYGPLTRAKEIRIKFLDETGKEKVETFKSFNAQIIQHEIDHLDGVLFVDRLLEQKKSLYKYHPKTDEWEEVDFAR